jgi:hypothetical protein
MGKALEYRGGNSDLTSALRTDGGRRRWAEAASCQGRRRRGSAARDHGTALAKPNAEPRARDRAWPVPAASLPASEAMRMVAATSAIELSYST